MDAAPDTDATAQLPMLLTVAQAVKASGLSRAELYRQMTRGNLTRKKVGRSTLIPRASLLALVENLPEA